MEVLLLALGLLEVSAQMRAGGGGGGGGGGGSGGSGGSGGGGLSGGSGSGSSGSGSSGSGEGGIVAVTLVTLIFVFTGGFFLLKRIYPRIRTAINTKKRKAAVSEKLEDFKEKKSMWSKENLKQVANSFFYELQDAWSNKDLDAIRRKLDNYLYSDWESQITKMNAEGTTNKMSDVLVKKVRIIDFEAPNENLEEPACYAGSSFKAWIKAEAKDQMISSDGRVIKNNQSKFEEIWNFVWETDTWLLSRIYQTSEVVSYSFQV